MTISNTVCRFPFFQEIMTYEQHAERGRAILIYKLFSEIKNSERQIGNLDIKCPLKMSVNSVFKSTLGSEISLL